MHIPEILTEKQTENAVTLLKNYYTERGSKGRVRTGSRFDTWAGGGDAPDVVNTITADDMLAASFLSVRFSPRASIGILETRRDDITALLAQIPADLDLTALNRDEVEKVLGEESPAWKLWDILRGKEDGGWGIGSTKASKLLARKRPRLIPIWDSVVKSETKLKGSLTQWDDWHAALTKDNAALALHLDEIQRRAELPHPVSRLRAMDVVLWMHGTGGGAPQPPTGEDEEA
ncbi:DUF6308 family protein [Arthrobacter sp. zg-Y769]|uniref:DUF6308 family protein n=1 Tax=Arthrobacter sp. zg-Y769 TaxID=2894191 RepID=UPI001E5C3C56|nr:DUF6308 family protein [Arthrobacter sp. zg-Y769]MCC9204134.1 DUF6308 family protein [Arthrobacter sp. zg-Y769]